MCNMPSELSYIRGLFYWIFDKNIWVKDNFYHVQFPMTEKLFRKLGKILEPKMYYIAHTPMHPDGIETEWTADDERLAHTADISNIFAQAVDKASEDKLADMDKLMQGVMKVISGLIVLAVMVAALDVTRRIR